jgi:hypothetical protein
MCKTIKFIDVVNHYGETTVFEVNSKINMKKA